MEAIKCNESEFTCFCVINILCNETVTSYCIKMNLKCINILICNAYYLHTEFVYELFICYFLYTQRERERKSEDINITFYEFDDRSCTIK